MEQLTLKDSNRSAETDPINAQDCLQVYFCTSFVLDPMQEFLDRGLRKVDFPVQFSFSPYNQVFQELLDPQSLLNQSKGVNFLFIRLEDWLRDHQELSPSLQIDFLNSTFQHFIAALKNSFKRSGVPKVVSVLPVSPFSGLQQDVFLHLAELNRNLEIVLKEMPEVHLVDLKSVASQYNVSEIFDPEADRIAHMPFAMEFYEALADFSIRKIRAYKSGFYKVIAVDCDNTLWKGVCGELGALNVIIDENYSFLQEFLIRKYNEGFLLVLATKNNEEDVWEVFDHHPGMKLKREHITAARINWDNKHGNLVSLSKELNLGINSFIFLDDSSFEVEQVKVACPEIHALCLPDNPSLFSTFLNQEWAFDVFRITEEDRKRNSMYRAENLRKQEQLNYIDIDDFLKSLHIELEIYPLEVKDLDRAVQLVLRTNQFNLNGIRKTPEEIADAIGDPAMLTWLIEVKDRFGEYGKTGLLIAKKIQEALVIETFLLSCRVLGRNVEALILEQLENYCTANGLNTILANYRQTAKNKPFYEFLVRTKWIEHPPTRTYALPLNDTAFSELKLTHEDLAPDTFKKDTIDLNAQDREPDFSPAPTTENETILYNIWKNVLKKDGFGINDDFFRIGGNSLQAVQVVSRISRHFETEMQLSEFYLQPTIGKLVSRLSSKIKGVDASSINKAEPRPERIPLSFSQERLWFIHQLEGSVHYHVPDIFRFNGEIDKSALENCLRSIVNRHEVLRTVILDVDGQPFQYIKKENQWALTLIDGSTYKTDADALRRTIQELINQPFDLSKDHMLRAHLVSVDKTAHILIITMHHIASDGWSTSIFIKELVEHYEAFVNHHSPDVQPLKIQYADYAIWQRNYLRGELLNQKIAYWKQKLEGVAPLQLPTDFQRPPVQTTRGASFKFNINEELTEQLTKLSANQGVTLFMTLLGAFKVLLYRYSGQTDICVGTPTAGRQKQELEDLIGFFVNTLALRSEIVDQASFIDYLHQLRAILLEAYANQELPFEKVVETVVKERDLSRTPLAQVLFVLQNTPEVPKLSLRGLTLTKEEYVHNTSKFDFSFLVTAEGKHLQVVIEYSTDLYLQESIQRMASHYTNLLQAIVETPYGNIGSLSMLSKDEEYQLLNSFNDTTVSYEERSITDLFEEQVDRTPGNTAVVFGQDRLTYRELNERANQLAHLLRSKGVKQDTLVPVCIERSLNMIIGVLAILKAGAAYVPIDPDYPLERIHYMLEDTRGNLILTSTGSKSTLGTNISGEIIEIDGDSDLISQQPTSNLKTKVTRDTLAYVIYTSGSTGKPKGVRMQGSALVNLLSWQDKQFQNKKRRILQYPSLNFDASFQDIFSTLCYGSELYLISSERRIDMAEVIKDIWKYKITHLFIPFIVLKNLAEAILPIYEESFPLEEIIVAGEQLKLTDDIKDLVKKSGLRLVNQYGPTEAHVVSSYTIDPYSFLPTLPPIGKPIDNTQLYILDQFRQLVPIGVAGELYIGGIQVALGYLNKPELTAERFIDDPFSKKAGAKLYKTGDLTRWLPDGNIEYLGRRDDQVKIRGYRIELGEIESVLQECTLVRQGVVLSIDDNNNRRLVGYVVPEGDYDRDAIVHFLKNRLPEYMVPALWVQMERLPVTSNGKIDRRKLPRPHSSEILKDQYVAPLNDAEKNLAPIWHEVLNVDRIGIKDNFFEVGGHSLLAMRLVSRIRKELQLELAIKELFLHPDIASLAAHIEKNRKGLELPPIKAVTKDQLIPLSYSQERLWFIDKLEGSLHYHLPLVLFFKGNLNKEALTHALHSVIDRHQILRTVIREQDGEPYQFIKNNEDTGLVLVNAAGYNDDRYKLSQYIDQLIDQPFDLANDDMVRAYLLQLNEGENVLVISMHHLVSDGWSLSIFISEVAEFYKAYVENRNAQVPSLQLQYGDYAYWQRHYLKGDLLDKKVAYWKNKLLGVSPLQLPTDFPRPSVQNTSGAINTFRISKELSKQLQDLSQEQGTTLFMTLQAAFKVLLHRYSTQDDICIGSAIADRQQQEVENLIGFFVNTLALRNEVKDEMPFTELLQQVRLTTLEAYEHQEVPFEKIVEVVMKERDMSRNPLFQVMLVWQNTAPVSHVDLGEVQLIQEEIGLKRTKFDITFIITETEHGLEAVVEYSTALYKASTIQRMTGHFVELLSSIVKAPAQSIGTLSLLPIPERQRLLEEFFQGSVVNTADTTLLKMFNEQVSRAPGNIALVFEKQQLTYKDLDERSDQLASFLLSKGIGEETVVPVCMGRSSNLVISLLAIMKAGGAYLPIDPEYPADRITFMVEDTKASLIITDSIHKSKFQEGKGLVIVDLDNEWPHVTEQPEMKPSFIITPGHLACVIYTSGSTGKPKGVMIEHHGLANLIQWHIREYEVMETSRATAMAGVGFDAFGWEIWPYLSSGASVHIVNDALRLETVRLVEFFRSMKITHSFVATALLPDFIRLSRNQKTSLRFLLTGGDKLGAIDIKGLEYTVVNNYGPTEYSVVTTNYRLSERDTSRTPPIGRPIGNTTVMIVDQQKQVVPIGIVGELCVGGKGLARGYLNQEALTKEKFTIHSLQPGEPAGETRTMRMYSTGDLVRWLEDGTIEYVGRKDDQVKIRGYRIELGEIEGVLVQSSLVSQALVLVKQDASGDKQLVAYVVPKEPFNRARLVEYLKERLPDYMIPFWWVPLETLPLTANGKIDKKALPEVDLSMQNGDEYTPPVTEMEKRLVEIWKELLHLERISIHDNFFRIGGHSLLARRMGSHIERNLSLTVPMQVLFQFNTISELSKYLELQLTKQPGDKGSKGFKRLSI